MHVQRKHIWKKYIIVLSTGHYADEEWYFSLREILNFQKDLGKFILILPVAMKVQSKMMVCRIFKYHIQWLIGFVRSSVANGRWTSLQPAESPVFRTPARHSLNCHLSS